MTDRTRSALRATAGALLFAALAPAPALATPVEVNLRVEGAHTTIYEHPITSDGHVITTGSGGSHRCDGTNGGANPSPVPVATAALDDGARFGGFTWDGTYFPSFQDYVVDRVGSDRSNSSQFWAFLVNYRFSQVGGCQHRVRQGDEVLWAFDGFSKKHVLRLDGPGSAHTGAPVAVGVSDGQTGSPMMGARVGGAVTGTDGRAVLRFQRPGVFALKAERSDSIRSNALSLCVDPAGAPPCTSTDKAAPTISLTLPGRYASDSSRSRTLLLSWQADDRTGGSGLQSYDLEVRRVRSGGTAAAPGFRSLLRNSRFTRAHFRGAAGAAYQFKVTARDRAGNRTEATSKPVIIPIDDRDRRKIHFSHGWRRLERKKAWGRFVIRSRRAGASARMRFTGTRVALIGRRLPRGGRLRVRVDGRAKTLRLRGKSSYRRVLFLSRRLRPGRHVLRLRALGSRPVELDAVARFP
jgi:hypothetical protein